jgi:hypothetical protein
MQSLNRVPDRLSEFRLIQSIRQRSAGVDVEFLKDFSEVVVNGGRTKKQFCTDLHIRFAAGREPRDLILSWGQSCTRVVKYCVKVLEVDAGFSASGS